MDNEDGPYKAAHVPDTSMPVDFVTKIVSVNKLRRSVDFMYNTSNRVTHGVPHPMPYTPPPP